MERNSAIDPGIQALSEFGALTRYDEIWRIDGRDYITVRGALLSYGEIWRVESHDRTIAVVVADSKEERNAEFPDGRNYEERHQPVADAGDQNRPGAEQL